MKRKNQKRSILLIITLIFFRVLWLWFYYDNDRPVLNGKAYYDPRIQDKVKLDGTWNFIENEWVSPDEIESRGMFSTIEVPKNWRKQFNSKKKLRRGTYFVEIQSPDIKEDLSLYTGNIKDISRIYINNEIVYNQADILKDKYEFSPQIIKISNKGNFMIVVHVESSQNRLGGIIRSMQLGKSEKIVRQVNLSRNSEVLTNAMLLTASIFSFFLFFLLGNNRRYIEISLVFFSLFFIFMLSSGEKIILQYVKIPIEMKVRLELFFVSTMSLCLMNLLNDKQSKADYNKGYLFLTLGTLVMPLKVLNASYNLYLIAFVFSIMRSIFNINEMQSINERSREALYYALISLLHHLIWWFMIVNLCYSVPHYPFDILLSIFFVLTAWIKNYEYLYLKYKNISQDLTDINHSREVFLSKTASSLLAPLNKINVLVDNVRTREKLEDKVLISRSDLDILRAVTIEANNLAENLLGFTTVSDDFPETLKLSPISLADKIEYVTSILEHEKEYMKITPVLNICNHTDLILGDRKKAVQLIFQLYSIASKIGSVSQIHFTTKRVSDKVELEVLMTGVDIREKHGEYMRLQLKKSYLSELLFDYDYGVEIELINTLVESQQGVLKIEENESGIIFKVSFERFKYKNKINKYKKKDTLPSFFFEDNSYDKEKILIVNSSPSDSMILKKVLEDKGYFVKVSESGEKITGLIEKLKPDLVIINVVMERENGFILTKKIREYYNHVELPIILMLTNTYQIEIKSVYQSGATDYIDFPPDFSEFIAKVENQLYTKRIVQESLMYEIAWLQAQIEPHFLFNTLNTIIGLSEFDQEKMQIVMDSLIELMHAKYRLSTPNKLITLEQEIELLKAYCQIEEIRFGDKIKIDFNIESNIDINKIKIYPFILQPLVENSIRHGLLPLQTRGNVSISIDKIENKEVIIVIADNGVGTSRSLEEILSEKEGKSGIGLVNTYYRLEKLGSASLAFFSKRYSGTEVIITLKDGEEDNENHDSR